MVRSYWNGALVLTLTWAGVAAAQQSPGSPLPGQPSERIVTFQEPGKPPQQCRVLSATPQPGGGTAYKMQYLATNEVFTSFDGPGADGRQPAAGGVRPISAQKVDGRVEGARQPGSPYGATAPIRPQPVGPGGPAQGPAAGNCGGCDGCGGCELQTVQEPGRPPMRCRLLRRWQMGQGCYACQMQCLDNGEMMTIVEDGPVTPVPGAPPGSRVRAVASRIFHWGRYNTSPQGAPVPPMEVIPPTVVAGPVRGDFVVCPTPIVMEGAPFPPGMVQEVVIEQAPPRPGLFSRLAGSIRGMFSKSPSAPTEPPAQATQAPPAVAAAPQKVEPPAPPKVAQAPPPAPPKVAQAPPPAQLPPPTDFRKSWDDPATRATAPKPAPVAPPPAPAVAQAPPRPPLSLPTPPASRTEVKDRPDPLLRPDSVASRAVEQKIQGFKPSEPAPRTEARAPTPPPAATPPSVPKPTPPATASPPGESKVPLGSQSVIAASNGLERPVQSRPTPPATASPPGETKVPLGSQSVVAASNGLERPVQYVPVPIVTMPEPKKPPMPPMPQIPQAPQPNNKQFVNAFSPPPMPGADQQQQQGGQGHLPPPGPMGGPPMMGAGYYQPTYSPNPMMARSPAPGYAPMGQGPMPMYGYNPMAQGMYPAGPYGMPVGMYPYPYGPMAMPQVPGRGTVPYVYQGPQPPNPFAGPMPYGYPPGYGRAPVAQGWGMGQPRNVAMDRPAIPAGMSPNQWAVNNSVLDMVSVLKTSTYPSQREWAANNLASPEWREHPAVVPALVIAARDDPAPTVRSGCVHNLARMGVTAEPVLATLRQLKNDADPRVRVEAERALTRLSIDPRPGPRAEPNAVQRVGATAP
jgi:hypothetical protein